MTLKVRKATAADIPSMNSAFFDAFRNDPIQQLVFPATSDESQRYFPDTWSADMRDDPRAHFIVVTDFSSPDADIIGFAKWVGPDDGAGSTREHASPPRPPLPSDGNVAIGSDFFGTMEKQHVQHMGTRRHWYLDLLGVRAGWQRKGVGGLLVKWGLEQAEKDGVEAYLSASPSGVPLYRRHGFREVETMQFPAANHTSVSMRWTGQSDRSN